MSMLKTISGHTTCAAYLQDYLDFGDKNNRKREVGYLVKNERALGHDFVNIPERHQKTWARYMDNCRKACGNDEEWRGQKAVTYRHFIISPSPADHVSLETMRDLAVSWVKSNFSQYQTAITYHQDNTNHIMHAHIIVNNTNIVTGKRLHFTDKETQDLADNLQTLAMERKLHHFSNVQGKDKYPANAHVMAEFVRERANMRAQFRDRRPSAQREYFSKSEKELVGRGVHSWKMDIRDKVLCAMWLCDGTQDGFVRELGHFGIRADIREDDVLYSITGEETHKALASRMGSDFSMDGLKRISTIASLKLNLEPTRKQVLARAIESPGVEADVEILSTGMSVAELRDRRLAAGIGLRDIHDALEYLGSRSISSQDELQERIRNDAAQHRPLKEQEKLQKAARIVSVLDLLPKSDDKRAQLLARREKAAKREDQREKSIPLRVRLEYGMRLTHAEYDALSEAQRQAWARARKEKKYEKLKKDNHSSNNVFASNRYSGLQRRHSDSRQDSSPSHSQSAGHSRDLSKGR